MNDDTVEQLFWPARHGHGGTPEQHGLGSGRPAMGDVVILPALLLTSPVTWGVNS
jgi:hypothetical protein